jgi:hypothetical protein
MLAMIRKLGDMKPHVLTVTEAALLEIVNRADLRTRDAEPKNYLTTGAVARIVGVAETRLQAILRKRPELRPEIVGGRRRWTADDLRSLEELLLELGEK